MRARRAGQEGTKAARLREGRGGERSARSQEKPGAEAAGERASEWELREGGGAGGRRASLEREGGERRRQAARGTRSRCRSGWTQPSLPTERGRRLGRRNPRQSPASGPGLPAPHRAALPPASGAAAHRLGKERDLLGAGAGDTHATHPGEATPPGNSVNWRNAARAGAGLHLPIAPHSWPERSPLL